MKETGSNYKLKSYKLKQQARWAVSLLVFSASVLITITGCSNDKAADGNFSMPPMPVEVAQVKSQNVSDQFEAVGTIEAVDVITVVSEIDAAVVSLPFQEGSYIKEGSIIAQLDDSQLSAEVIRTEALYDQSKANYDRIKAIVEQKAGTQQALDNAAADLKVAEANLKLAQARLNKTRIVAPFSGTIGARKVSVGTFLRTGDAITELANLNEIRVSFTIPERFLSQLKKGAEVTVSTTVYPGHEVKGSIVAIEPVIDPGTRTAQIIARVKNPEQKFRSGMSANISVVLSERPEALTIPTEAVFANGNQSFVYMVKPDSTVAPVPVTLGLQLSSVVEVVNGLQKDMQVVTAGHQKLFPGAKVIPVTNQEVKSPQ